MFVMMLARCSGHALALSFNRYVILSLRSTCLSGCLHGLLQKKHTEHIHIYMVVICFFFLQKFLWGSDGTHHNIGNDVGLHVKTKIRHPTTWIYSRSNRGYTKIKLIEALGEKTFWVNSIHGHLTPFAYFSFPQYERMIFSGRSVASFFVVNLWKGGLNTDEMTQLPTI